MALEGQLPPDACGAEVEHSNVFVRGLPGDIDEEGLRDMFKRFGVIESCRVLRNARSQGYGFVKFSLHHEAVTAIASMQGHVVDASSGPLEVKFANADPASRALQQTPSDNLYIRNLPSTFTEADLAHLFSAFGGVKECRMLHAPPGAGPPHTTHTSGGLVRLASAEAAATAIEQLNARPPLPGATLPLLVRYADTPEEKLRKAAKKERLAPFSRGGIGGSSSGGSGLPAGFMAFSAPAGTLDPGRAGGYARPRPPSPTYMPYAGQPSPYYAQEAMKLLMLSSQDAAVAAAGPSYAGRGPPTSLYVKNLPPEADRLYLYEFFAPLGAVQSVRVLTDDSGACRGVGFVNYADNASAVGAIQALHGTPVAGGRVLHVSLQPPRDRGTRSS